MAITFYYNNDKIQIFKIFSGTLNDNIPMHSHPKNGYEVHLIDYGSGILETNGEKHSTDKGTLFITGPNVSHKQTPSKENPMHELCVYFKIPCNKNTSALIKGFTSNDFWIGKCTDEIMHIFKLMIGENEKSSILKDDILSTLSIRLISEITRLYYPDNISPSNLQEQTDLNENRSWILDQLLLDDCSNVTLNDFAENMGVSPRQAQRIIIDYYGASFKKLRYEAKMAMAATILEGNDVTIDECAEKCGYSCASSFISAFKSKFKTTPKKYREQIIKSNLK